MTESEWLVCTDLDALLIHLRAGVSDRRLRLFACACCRRVLPLLDDEEHDDHRRAVEVAERYADGRASVANLRVAQRATTADEVLAATYPDGSPAFDAVANVAVAAARAAAWRVAAEGSGSWVPSWFDSALAAETAAQCSLFRDIVGNPFLPVAARPSWLTPTVVALARGIDEEGTFDHLPILADALEEAACTDADLLGHLRGPGPHTRGCWALGLLLNRE